MILCYDFLTDEDIEYKKIPIIIIEDEDEDIKEKFSWFSETSK